MRKNSHLDHRAQPRPALDSVQAARRERQDPAQCGRALGLVRERVEHAALKQEAGRAKHRNERAIVGETLPSKSVEVDDELQERVPAARCGRAWREREREVEERRGGGVRGLGWAGQRQRRWVDLSCRGTYDAQDDALQELRPVLVHRKQREERFARPIKPAPLLPSLPAKTTAK